MAFRPSSEWMVNIRVSRRRNLGLKRVFEQTYKVSARAGRTALERIMKEWQAGFRSRIRKGTLIELRVDDIKRP